MLANKSVQKQQMGRRGTLELCSLQMEEIGDRGLRTVTGVVFKDFKVYGGKEIQLTWIQRHALGSKFISIGNVKELFNNSANAAGSKLLTAQGVEQSLCDWCAEKISILTQTCLRKK